MHSFSPQPEVIVSFPWGRRKEGRKGGPLPFERASCEQNWLGYFFWSKRIRELILTERTYFAMV